MIGISEPNLPNIPNIAFGIDLGTTNSLIALAGGQDIGDVLIFRDNKNDNDILPSVVLYDSKGEVSVGCDAFTGESIHSVKRLMGTAEKIDVGHGFYKSPIEISAEILKKLCERVYIQQGIHVEKAVITVPAYFDESARLATKQAAALAGIEVLRLLNEPTAALLAYGIDCKKQGIYAIYDLGGGTFDISILKLHQGVFQVLAVGGDAKFGGDDFDEILAKIILSKVKGSKIDQNLLLEARKLKEKLTENVLGSCQVDINGERQSLNITREEFESAILDKVAITINLVLNTLNDAKLSIDDLQELVLVGGSTRIPLIHSELRKVFADKVIITAEPEKTVVLGAALQARSLTSSNLQDRNIIVDVLPLSLGIETIGGIVEKIIPRNTPIPTVESQVFTNYVDGQTSIQINVCQGEREMIAQNKTLARIELTGITPMPAGLARIKVEFQIDIDGLLIIRAIEEISGVSKVVEVNAKYGLDDKVIQSCVEDAVANFEQDVAFKELAKEKVNAGEILRVMQNFLHANSNTLTNSEFSLICDKVSALEAILSSANIDEIRCLVADLKRNYESLLIRSKI